MVAIHSIVAIIINMYNVVVPCLVFHMYNDTAVHLERL